MNEGNIMIKTIFIIFIISTIMSISIVLIGNRIVDLIYRDKDE